MVFYEILRYATQHNWSAYEAALKTNPVFAKMMICDVVYSLGDWIAQCNEGKPLFEFDQLRMLRSGFVGFTLHGSLSHYCYQLCEVMILSSFLVLLYNSMKRENSNYFLCCLLISGKYPGLQAPFPFQEWWVVPVKMVFDQTA